MTFEPSDAEIWEAPTALQSTAIMKKGVPTQIQEPVLNNSHHDAVSQPKVILRSLHQIQPILSLEPLKLIDKEKQQLFSQSNTSNTT